MEKAKALQEQSKVTQVEAKVLHEYAQFLLALHL